MYRLVVSDTWDRLIQHTRAWNSLPSSLQELTDTKTFKRKLKTFLFQQAYHWTRVVLSVSFCFYSIFTRAMQSAGQFYYVSGTHYELYLSDEWELVYDVTCRLQWSDTFTCVSPWTVTQLGYWSFTVAGPWVWNVLLSLVDNYSPCRHSSVPHLFSMAWNGSHLLQAWHRHSGSVTSDILNFDWCK